MKKFNPKVDGFLRKQKQWRDELAKLRQIVLDCGLTEEVKWRTPCYTFEDSNIVLISGLKDYCALSFMKGALLKDGHDILVKPGENTRSGRLIKFTSVKEIVKLERVLKAYIREAVEVEKAGLKVDFKKDAELPVPQEVQNKFDENPELKAAFDALTPGRRRGYLLHFSAAKQSRTRAARVDKCAERIFAGKGFNER